MVKIWVWGILVVMVRVIVLFFVLRLILIGVGFVVFSSVLIVYCMIVLVFGCGMNILGLIVNLRWWNGVVLVMCCSGLCV